MYQTLLIVNAHCAHTFTNKLAHCAAHCAVQNYVQPYCTHFTRTKTLYFHNMQKMSCFPKKVVTQPKNHITQPKQHQLHTHITHKITQLHHYLFVLFILFAYISYPLSLHYKHQLSYSSISICCMFSILIDLSIRRFNDLTIQQKCLIITSTLIT